MKNKYFFLFSSLVLAIIAISFSLYLKNTSDVAPEDSEASPINIASTPPIVDGVYALDERHPDAGVWMAYPRNNTAADMARPHIKGVMAYTTLKQLFTGITGGSRDTVGTAQFSWNTLDSELDKIINQAGKKAMVNISAGYCPDEAWPPPDSSNVWPHALYDRLAHNKTRSSGRCHSLQFWDPLYFSYNPATRTGSGYLYQYIRAQADHMAQFDSTDSRPNETDITYIHSMAMAIDMENVPNDGDLQPSDTRYDWSNYDPATNGRIYQVDLTETIVDDYSKKVALAYHHELERAYAAAGLPVASSGSSKMGENWSRETYAEELVDNGVWIDDHNFTPNPEGWFWDHMPFSKNTSRTRNTSEGGYHDPEPILVQANVWSLFASLHSGQEFIMVYGNNQRHLTTQPLGPIQFTENMPLLEFTNKYAGTYRNPTTSPGAWIALRGFYPENRWTEKVEHDHLWTNYEMLMTQYRPQDSVFLFGQPNISYAAYQNLVPVVNRTPARLATDIVDCDARYGVTECNYIRSQLPTVPTGTADQFTYPISDLGIVHYCGSNDFCTNASQATRSEPMLWARRTNKAVSGGTHMRFDLNDTFADSVGSSVQIRVAYLDQGTGSWQLLRDSDVVVGTVNKTNSNIWKEQTFTVSGASFNNSGTGGTDLALYNGGSSNDDDTFHMIEVMRVGVASTPTPTQTAAPTSTPTPSATAVTNLTLSPVSCLSGPTSTEDALTISWTNPAGGPNANMVQIGTTSSFTPSSFRRSTGVSSVSSVTAPNGFTLYSGSTNTGEAFVMQPDTTYYVRVYNGSYTPNQTVTIPTCQTATPTPINVTPTPTSTAVITPTPIPTVSSTPTPVPTISKASINSIVTQGCITGGTFTVNWTNPGGGDAVSAIDVSTDINFANNNFYHKTQLTAVTSYTGPSGYVHRDTDAPLILQPNTNYYVRVWNGVHSDQTSSTVFSMAACPTPTPVGTNQPETIPTPTPTPVITPRSNNRGGGGGGGGGRTSTSNETCNSPFNDIGCDNKFIDYISELKSSQVVNGYSDGSYKPSSNVTRAEMATFIVNAFDLTTDNIETKMTYQHFSDSIEGTHKQNIVILKSLNVVSGYSDFTYRPQEYVKREEISKFIYNALKAKGVAVSETNSTFVDVSSKNEFYQYIGYLQYSDVIGGYSDGRYGPSEPLTREQMAKIITLSREVK